MGDGRREKLLLALASLLHDIGKFVQRARNKGFEDLGGVDLRWNRDKHEKDFKYEHAYLSKVFLDFLKKEGIIEGIISEDKKDKLIEYIEYGVRHHSPTDELESVISQVADWYSSSERESKMGSCINLLHSVFERVSLKPKEERVEEAKDYRKWNVEENLICEDLMDTELKAPIRRKFGFYKLCPLSPKADIFPRIFTGAIFVKKTDKDYDYLIVPDPESLGKNEVENYEKAYRRLFEDFIEELKQLKDVQLTEEQFFNYVYYILYKYTWCVPASTYDTEKQSRHYPDISLFDHSRVLSAIAVSLYDWAKTNNKNAHDLKPNGKDLLTDEESVFLLVEGDIGGIQNFIYNIHKATAESELSIAKALRGRSFFLTMLPEVLARYILKELGYPITNALYVGGGKFQLLVANTDRNVRKFSEIEKKINEWMHREFQGELNLSIATVPMKGKALRHGHKRESSDNDGPITYLDHVEWLQLELDKKKKRKLGELLFGKFDKDPTSAENICPSCRTLHKHENSDLCKWCYMSQEWGSVLPKVRYIAFDWGEEKDIKIDKRKTMNFGDFGNVYLLEEGDLDKVKDLPEVLDIEDTCMKLEKDKIVNGFKFVGHSAPRVPDRTDDELFRLLNEIWKEKLERRREHEK
ncbi:MAG: type III-A CRISPR-associated protein Cas10/Csm1, partial [Aquificota bacterium]|nr:type III-A CRISPR-associated protein Cas10/Csm1 [Aquificota bacterium]